MREPLETARHEGRGAFITFEGGDGSGKTTHVRFLANCLRDRGYEVVCLREPGATEVGEKLRQIVLDPGNEALSDEAELLIYEAARAQVVHELIAPALERGAVVLCDRFADSSLAYQGYGRGLDLDFITRVNAFACRGLVPVRTILMTTGASADVGLARATKHHDADRLELAGQEFHKRVAEGFAAIAETDSDRIRVVVSADRKSQTARAVFSELADLFPWMDDPTICDDALFAVLDAPKTATAATADGTD